MAAKRAKKEKTNFIKGKYWENFDEYVDFLISLNKRKKKVILEAKSRVERNYGKEFRFLLNCPNPHANKHFKNYLKCQLIKAINHDLKLLCKKNQWKPVKF